MPSNRQGGARRCALQQAAIVIAAVFSLVVLAACGAAGSTAPTQTLASAGTPTAVERGRALFVGEGACLGCHTIDGSARGVGPDMLGMAERVAEQFPRYELADYLRESIVDVYAAVPEGYHADLMPADYAERLTDGEIDDLVAFMLSLQ